MPPSSMITDSLKSIGKVGKPHGLRGGFFIAARNSILPETYHKASVVLSSGRGESFPARISSHSLIQNRSMLSLDTFQTRTCAEKYKGWDILVSKELEDDPLVHLLGAKIQDSAGHDMGEVTRSFNFGGVDTIEVWNEAKKMGLLMPLAPSFFDLDELEEVKDSYSLTVTHDAFEELWYPEDQADL